MRQDVFVTGTDTSVGKTTIATALVRGLVAQGLRVAVMKPVASGSVCTPEGLRNADALELMDASNLALPYAKVNPFCYYPAVSPHIAAKEASVPVDLHQIRQCFEELLAVSDAAVIEGAGGWLTPVSDTETMADVARVLGVPVLMVVGLRLGCLNHALLTRLAIESGGLKLAGWVANGIDPAMERQAENLATLEQRLGQPPLAVVQWGRDAEVNLSL